jgi:D-glycero-D-manno-heptose 1,7-bisphosphate phosphatase
MIYIFDADGTLRESVNGQPCPNKPDEWKLLPNVEKTLKEIDWSKNYLGIASNQGGIALGYLDLQMAYQLCCDLIVAATGRWPPTGCIQICPHAPDAGCSCRKPSPLMLERIMAFWGTRDAVMIGDMDSDREAADAAGIPFIWAKDFFRCGKQLKGAIR